jgi:hypothetical protein
VVSGGAPGVPRKAGGGGVADDGPAPHGGHPHDPRHSANRPARSRHRPVWENGRVSIWDDDVDEGRAPICPYCGVTALPAELSHVLDTDFVCDNADCDAYGDRIDP